MQCLRRQFLKTVLQGTVCLELTYFSGCMPIQHINRRQRKPNIILICTHGLSCMDLGCYGQKQVKTPHLDRMAKQGKIFTRFYACTLDYTIAEIIKRAGYMTGCIGIWSKENSPAAASPFQSGFDYFFGYSDSDNIAKMDYTPDLFLQESLAFIEEYADQAFFLCLSGILPDTHISQDLKYRLSSVACIDHYIYCILKKIRKLGLDSDTVVFFTSYTCSNSNTASKINAYNSMAKAPLIVRWPGKIKPGITDHISTFRDFKVTLACLSGASARYDCPGDSLLPVLSGYGIGY